MVPAASLYDHPYYYEIAFSYRDIEEEVDVIEQLIEKYSKTPVHTVLEIGCGPAPHMPELAKRGYHYVGIDINEKMLQYARQKAEKLGIKADLIKADMRSFTLKHPADFAFVLLGSLYAKTTQDILSHLNSMAKALKPGALYLLDWCIHFQWDKGLSDTQEWTIQRDNVKVDVTYTEEPLNRAAQTYRRKILATVNHNEKTLHLQSTEEVRAIFPQEFLLLLEKTGKFELIGWWNNWNLNQPIEKAAQIARPITVIRRI